jgi:hypothetical protein
MLADSLFSSWVRVVLFWYVSLFIWWGFSDTMIEQSMNNIPNIVFETIEMDRCELGGVECDKDGSVVIKPLNAIFSIGHVFAFWGFPVLMGIGLSAGSGSSGCARSAFGCSSEQSLRCPRSAMLGELGPSLPPRPLVCIFYARWHRT